MAFPFKSASPLLFLQKVEIRDEGLTSGDKEGCKQPCLQVTSRL